MIIAVYGLVQIQDLYFHPVYNSYPTTYDYDYASTFKINLRENMVSYLLTSDDFSNPLKTLRVVFKSSFLKSVPAVYCQEYFAEEIAAE